MQLWQFLLKLLIDRDSKDIISWCGDNGEFVLHDPEAVAHLWGKFKGKPNMDYQKLARSIRYYYGPEKMMIKKENNKKFTYRFEMDLMNVLGYDAAEIQKQMLHVERIRENSPSP